jgi:sulfite exporter TauE/SafE
MDLAAVNSPEAAFVAGLVTSLHCAGMCGPLACALMPGPGDRDDGQSVATVYHVCRLSGYALVGALAGGLGREPLGWVSRSGFRWLPWLMVVFFLGLALRWDRWLPRPAALARWTYWLQSRWRGRSRLGAAAAIGLGTPLLPCGPLYFIATLALLAGSAERGVELMLAFGLGTVPLLWVAQSRTQWVRGRLSPVWLNRLRVGLGLAAALVVTWRLRGTLGIGGANPNCWLCGF